MELFDKKNTKAWETKPYVRKIELRLTDQKNKSTHVYVYSSKNTEFDVNEAREELHQKLDVLMDKTF